MEPRKGRGVFVRPAEQRSNGNFHAQRRKSIGFALFGHYSTIDPEAQHVLHGATSVLQESGRQIFFRVFADEVEIEQQLPDFLETVGGLIITRDVTQAVIETVLKANVNVVRLDYRPRGQTANPFSEVFCEAERSGHLAAQQLLMHGHRQLAVYTTKHEDLEYVNLTYEGVCRGCREHQADPPHLFAAPDASSQGEAIRDMVDRQDLTGVIAIDDLTACRLIRELVALDVNVPESKSVVSIGGLPRDQLTEPDLARVNRGYFEMGAETARTLLLPSKLLVKNSLDVSFEAGRTLQPK